jgi:hypothetical protein
MAAQAFMERAAARSYERPASPYRSSRRLERTHRRSAFAVASSAGQNPANGPRTLTGSRSGPLKIRASLPTRYRRTFTAVLP